MLNICFGTLVVCCTNELLLETNCRLPVQEGVFPCFPLVKWSQRHSLHAWPCALFSYWGSVSAARERWQAGKCAGCQRDCSVLQELEISSIIIISLEHCTF